jgi:DNA-directed RNA polymerase specialized sigma subunit
MGKKYLSAKARKVAWLWAQFYRTRDPQIVQWLVFHCLPLVRQAAEQAAGDAGELDELMGRGVQNLVDAVDRRPAPEVDELPEYCRRWVDSE